MMVVPVRMLTPDTSLWDEMADLVSLVGGVQALALMAAAFSAILGAGMWGLGHAIDRAGMSAAGRAAIGGACVVAAMAAGLPNWIGWLIAKLAAV